MILLVNVVFLALCFWPPPPPKPVVSCDVKEIRVWRAEPQTTTLFLQSETLGTTWTVAP